MPQHICVSTTLCLCQVNISLFLVGNCILLVDNDMYFSIHFGTTMTKIILNLFIASTCHGTGTEIRYQDPSALP